MIDKVLNRRFMLIKGMLGARFILKSWGGLRSMPQVVVLCLPTMKGIYLLPPQKLK